MDLNVSGTVTTDGAGTPALLDFTGLNVDLTGRMLWVTMTLSQPIHNGNISLYLGAGGWTNYIRWAFNVDNTGGSTFKPGDKTQVTLQLAELHEVAGNITWINGVPSTTTGFTQMRIRVTDDADGSPVTVTLHGVKTAKPALPGAYCSITFDDGYATTTSRAYPSMNVFGFRGTEYIVTEYVDTATRVTMADLRRRYTEGWEIAGHAYTHTTHAASYTGLTAAEAATDLASLKAWLEANFPDPAGHTMAYPLGRFGDTTDGVPVEQLIANAGFTAGRSTLSNPGATTQLQIESLMPPIRTRLYAADQSGVDAGYNMPANLIAPGAMLDKLQANGGWLILTFHEITAGAATQPTQCSQADFDAIMEALAARAITVLPVRDVLQLPRTAATLRAAGLVAV